MVSKLNNTAKNCIIFFFHFLQFFIFTKVYQRLGTKTSQGIQAQKDPVLIVTAIPMFNQNIESVNKVPSVSS